VSERFALFFEFPNVRTANEPIASRTLETFE